MSKILSAVSFGVLLVCMQTGCGGGVSSDEQAQRAYLGLDKSIGKSLVLGFAGFNAASSANIAAQMTSGDAGGTLTITGQVDQGASANKGMRLRVGMVDYTDGKVTLNDKSVNITYSTNADPTMQPELNLSLRGIPSGDFTGTIAGTFQMRGDLSGDVTLNLSMAGDIEDDGTGKVRRVAGSTHVTGTAQSGGGNYNVDITL